MPNKSLDQSEIEDFCQNYGFYGYMEISVKKDIMAKETIEYIISKIENKREKKFKLKKEVQKVFEKEKKLSNDEDELSNNSSFRHCCILL